MEIKSASLENLCNFQGGKPAMITALPARPGGRKKPDVWPICSVWTIAASVSELSAIAQYINNENRISGENRAAAKVILSIAMAEMMHLQKLGN